MRPIIIFVFLTWLVGSITAAASPPTSDQRFQMHSAKFLEGINGTVVDYFEVHIENSDLASRFAAAESSSTSTLSIAITEPEQNYIGIAVVPGCRAIP